MASKTTVLAAANSEQAPAAKPEGAVKVDSAEELRRRRAGIASFI